MVITIAIVIYLLFFLFCFRDIHLDLLNHLDLLAFFLSHSSFTSKIPSCRITSPFQEIIDRDRVEQY